MTGLVLRYDAANRLTDLVEEVGIHRLTWTGWGALASEDGPWVQDTVTYGHNNSLRRQSLNLAQPNASDWTQTYGYDGSWRLQSVTSPTGSFSYDYQGPSPLVNRLTLPNTSYLTNLFDETGRLLSSRLLTSTQTVLNAHAYQYNAAHQRTRQTLTEGNYWDYGYDALSQLTSAKGKTPVGANRVHEQLTYGYDKAGNLTKRTNNALIQTFTLTNSLNQLNGVSRSGTFTVAGLVQGTATNVTVQHNTNTPVSVTPYADQSFARAGVSLLSGTNTFTAVARDASNRLATNIAISYLPSSISCTYDANGNLTSDGRRTLEYDDADQLKAVQIANAWRTEFQYDAFGRRRIKREFVWLSGIWNLASEVRYVYDHLLVLQERDGNNVPLVTYTRGQDLSGSLQAAGGIGGLLARTDPRLLAIGDPSAHAYYHADAGGNITALVDSRQRLVARYRYDPFGNLLGLAGPLAEANLYRFSSKEYHPASGLSYYGYRFYDPSLQRWLNRDSIGETGGFNLYGFVGNDSMNWFDPYGLEVGFWESFIPVWGFGKQACEDFQAGHWAWGTFNAAVAVSDVVPLKAAGTAVAKGAWKCGSHTWGATSKWLTKCGWREFKEQHMHHWAIPREMFEGTRCEAIFNQPWNLMPMESQVFHNALHGKEKQAFNFGERLWYGTPTWLKAVIFSLGGREANWLRNDSESSLSPVFPVPWAGEGGSLSPAVPGPFSP